MQESYLHLPTRTTNNKKLSILTNIYEIRTERFATKYYLYHILPNSSRFKIISSHLNSKVLKGSLRQHIGFVGFYKGGLLGSIKIENLADLEWRALEKEDLVVVMSEPKEVDVEEVLSGPDSMNLMGSLLNGYLRNAIRKRQSQSKIFKLDKIQFQKIFDLRMSLATLNRRIWLTTDVRVRVRERWSVLEYIQHYKGADAIQLLRGTKIMKNYGSKSILEVQQIKLGHNSSSKMEGQEELSYEEYFLKKYDKQIKCKGQPLLVAVLKQKSGGVKRQILLPQLVSLVDNSCHPDAPPEIARRLAKVKRILPQQKQSKISQLIRQLGADDVIKKSAITLQASLLYTPDIVLDGMNVIPQQGVFEFRHKILLSPELRHWAVAYSLVQRENGREGEQKEKMMNYLRNLAGTYGVKILSNPSEIKIGGRSFEAWSSGLQDNFKKYGKLQVILLFLQEEEEQIYSKLKQLLTIKLKCPSQVIRKRMLFGINSRKPYAVISHAMLQIITKIGAIPWSIAPQKTTLSQSLIMQAGLHLSRSEKGISISLVGSTGKQGNMIYSYFKKDIKHQELQPLLENTLIAWAKSFVVNLKSPPDAIILYRTGNQPFGTFQTSSFFALGSKIGQKIKRPSFCAHMAFVQVLRQGKVQFYGRGEEGNSQMILKNAETGTVVYEVLEEKAFNFYLLSESSLDSSVKPVKYRVLCNGSGIKKQDLAQFTYQQCYCYFNFQGATAVPSLLQNALKMTRLNKRFTSFLSADDKLTKFPYYL